MAFYIKRNDTSPAILAQLVDGNDDPVLLTGATIRFHMKSVQKSTFILDEAASIDDEDNSIVRYDWDASDTEASGVYRAEFEVTYADGSIETFPNDGYISVIITDDLA